MASENLTMELWEIIQKNNKEEISLNDFENDLNKLFNLPKDEVDRALSIMISQAEVNPNIIGEYKGGSFMISQSLAANITSVIKYENQFIPGKQEYVLRENGDKIIENATIVAILGLKPEIIDRMLNDYDNLSANEKSILAENYLNFSEPQKDYFSKKVAQNLKEKAKAAINPEEKEFLEGQAKSTEDARDNTKKDMETDIERISAIAILEKMYPEIIIELKKGYDIDQLSIKDIYTKVKEIAEKMTIEFSVKVDAFDPKKQNFEEFRETKDYKRCMALQSVTGMISFLQNREYEKFNMTLEDFLASSIEEMQLMMFGARTGNYDISTLNNIKLGNLRSENENFRNNDQVLGKSEKYTVDGIRSALYEFVSPDSVAYRLLDERTVNKEDNIQYEQSVDGVSRKEKVDYYMHKDVQSNRVQIMDEIISSVQEYKSMNSVYSMPVEQSVVDYIRQIPFALKKAGFETKDIVSSIQKYITVIEGISFEEDDEITDKIVEEIQQIEASEEEKKILEKLSLLKFNFKLDDLMLDHKDFLIKEMKQGIEDPRLIISTNKMQFNKELEEVLDDYFSRNCVEMDTSAIGTPRSHGDSEMIGFTISSVTEENKKIDNTKNVGEKGIVDFEDSTERENDNEKRNGKFQFKSFKHKISDIKSSSINEVSAELNDLGRNIQPDQSRIDDKTNEDTPVQE